MKFLGESSNWWVIERLAASGVAMEEREAPRASGPPREDRGADRDAPALLA